VRFFSLLCFYVLKIVRPALVRAVFVEVTRLNKRDHAFPTPRRLISAACLRTLTVLQQVELIDLQLGDFVEFSQPSHLDVVRMVIY